ncbi:homeobox-DDT domain protein RLT3 [Ziziphus jujuba]|nr:homeobox-DDT domain protein RLT3 [Ziziphus jujuba]
MVRNKKQNQLLQDLFNPNYILKKVFRKDGPPLGVEFDSPPPPAFSHCKDNQRATKRLKVSKHVVTNHTLRNAKNAPVRKHGIGKGLMTVWRATNPHGGDLPTGVGLADREVTDVSNSTFVPQNPQMWNRRPQQRRTLTGKLRNKGKEERLHLVRRRKMESNKQDNRKLLEKSICELALEGRASQENFHRIAMLVDDEELELRELQSVGDTPSSCDHFATSGLQGCSLCKDLLAKFPPNSVKMKQPFCLQPWKASPEIVKKLFKVFHFLYTYSIDADICPFTLDEFAQSFYDKDSLLLGKIHVSLLKLLLSNVQAELSGGSLPHLSKSCNFLVLLHTVENQEFTLELWKRCLNPLTWTEILRQVLVAAGFGSKQGSVRRDAISKEMNLMVNYSLRPGSMKGELFKILLEQGNNGLKVSELVKSLQMVDLNLANTTEELESLICTVLSSDITLFEKISSSTYRLRIDSVMRKFEDYQSDTGSGAVDDDPSENATCSSDDDSGCDAGNFSLRRLKYMNCHKSNVLKVYTEIDESHSGEVWLLGLMEGEYSDLSIEEKLNVLVTLIDLLRAGSNIRMENPTKAAAECFPNIHNSGSGAKIKRFTAKQPSLPRSCWDHVEQIHGVKEYEMDSSASILKFYQKSFGKGSGKETESGIGSHPMQSVFLGSDRRYNRYWLFLGPCCGNDPGHRRVYFESSEDGHWEVIDTEEALCALLSVLDDRGKREAFLIESLERRRAFLCQAMSSKMVTNTGPRQLTQFDQFEVDMVGEDSYSPVSDVDNNLALSDSANNSLPSSGAVILEVGKKGEEEQKQNWSRLQEFDSWIWNSFYLELNAVKHGKRSYFDTLARCDFCHDLYWRDEKHCRICHTTFEVDFNLEERYAIHAATCRKQEAILMFPKHKILSSQIQSLKAAIHSIELVMPEDALVGAWTKSAHKLWVKRLRRTTSLAELFQVLADFVGAINEDWLCQCNVVQDSYILAEEIMACFTSIPHTTSAVALWLVKLDALIAPLLGKNTS